MHTSVSLEGFYAYGCFSYVPAPLTPVENLFAVPAGAEITWNAETPEGPPKSHIPYQWREAADQSNDGAKAVRTLRRLLAESVAEQVAGCAREPMGVFLSVAWTRH
jgi:asparagine synthase (glutamine-hydrolysing)